MAGCDRLHPARTAQCLHRRRQHIKGQGKARGLDSGAWVECICEIGAKCGGKRQGRTPDSQVFGSPPVHAHCMPTVCPLHAHCMPTPCPMAARQIIRRRKNDLVFAFLQAWTTALPFFRILDRDMGAQAHVTNNPSPTICTPKP
eukprot:206046-Chlamydomonas_euryale.AAC.1